MKRNYYLLLAAFSGLTAVAIGAFGAHGIKPHLSAYEIEIFTTANRYHFYHALALLLISLYGLPRKSGLGKWAFITLFSGILCFSGSLYLLATKQLIGIEALGHMLGPVTPIGGLLFIIGWGLIMMYGARAKAL